MSRRIKATVLFLAIVFFAALFYFASSRSGGGLVFTGRLSDVFSGREPDQVIWLDKGGGNLDRPDVVSKAGREIIGKNAELPKEPTVAYCPFAFSIKGMAGRLAINEVAWMGGPTGSEAEWIELKNVAGAPLAIGGYQLADKAEQIRFVFPQDFILPAAGFYVLARENQRIGADAYYSGILANSGEGLRLFDSDCRLIDEVLAENNWPAGDNDDKKTMERNANGVWRDSLAAGGTPGRENSALDSAPIKPILEEDPVAETAVQEPSAAAWEEPPAQQEQFQQQIVLALPVISEIMAGRDGNANYEFIELYNPNNESFDLTGWSLRKRNTKGNEESLATPIRFKNKVISPLSYFLLVNEGGYDGSVAADATWAPSNILGYSNYAVVFYNPEGNKVEEVGWQEDIKNKSYERQAVNSSEFFVQDSPNPKSGSF